MIETPHIHPDRIHSFNEFASQRGDYVLYWMQQSQRLESNHALAYAIERANKLSLPVLIAFVINEAIPEANLRHYYFMIQGLSELFKKARELGFGICLLTGGPTEVLKPYLVRCSEFVTDIGYLRWQRLLRLQIAGQLFDLGIPFTAVESDVVIPVGSVSSKEEYAAYSIRPKICRLLTQYISPPTLPELLIPFIWSKTKPDLSCQYQDNFEPDKLLESIKLDRSVSPVSAYKGGYSAAKELLRIFIEDRLPHYSHKRSDPGYDFQSNLSPYLHFGQISVLEVVQEAIKASGVSAADLPDLIRTRKKLQDHRVNLADFLEELIIRRELSMNFCRFNEAYDDYTALPQWALNTLRKHSPDLRNPKYSLDRLENAETDDVYWNAAQTEMLSTGKMHNYMRMYWGKKMIEWTDTPADAFHYMTYLNNKYQLDGRDPNSYAGIAWCFGKHDRPWQERKIFGQVRYMNSAGLKRKFNMEAYLTRIKQSS